jgi:Tol biopolymer transport system component
MLTPPPPTAMPVLISPEALLNPRGAPDHVYLVIDHRLLAFTAEGTNEREILDDSVGPVLAASSSPSGDRVGALVRAESGYEIVILDASGQELQRLSGISDSAATPAATPVADQHPGFDLINWSPQGDRFLVALATGGIFSIPLSGPVTVLATPEQAPAPIDAAWSPAGNAVAFVNMANAGRGGDLFIVRDGQPPASLITSSEGGPSVVRVGWHPTGKSILFTRTEPSGAMSVGGDLFQIDPNGGTPLFVASAGRAAPVSAIVAFRPSPDGRAVAYTVVVPGSDGPIFHSLWVHQLGTANASRIAVPRGVSVIDIWWTKAGLIFQGTAASDSASGTPDAGVVNLYLATSDGEVRQTTGGAAQAATPVASPVSTSEPATSGTPGATSNP